MTFSSHISSANGNDLSFHETYKVMLKDYAPQRVSVLVTSSGGNMALGMVAYINDGHGDMPMPGHIMAISPGTCVVTEEEWQRMVELDRKDVAIDLQYFTMQRREKQVDARRICRLTCTGDAV